MGYIIFGIIIFIIIILITRIKIVPQAQVYIVERLGTFYSEWSTGPHFLVPFLDRVAKKVSIKDQIVDFKPQSVITKDNVSMQIDTVVFFQVTDAKQYAYGVERPISAIENLTATTLRNIIGDMELDETLTSRDRINKQITAILDEATDRWLLENHCKRSRPVSISHFISNFRNNICNLIQCSHIRNMHDQRIIRRSALCRINLG